MNGPQDLGGRQGFGAVAPEADEPVFHADWEKRVLGVTLAAGALRRWTLDESRHARERLPPAFYLGASYYEIWLSALEELLVHHGIVSRDELAAGHPSSPADENQTPPLPAERVAAVLSSGGPTLRPIERTAAFEVGDRIRTKPRRTPRHTRLPAYVWDKPGTIVRVHGAHVFPDSNAHGEGEQPQWLYNVAFAARDLFGDEAEERGRIHLDLWEPYLERAAG